MWITPKTDWKATDSFDLYTDYFRIKNNMLEVAALVKRYYGELDMIPLNDYGIEGVGFADFFNNIEENIDILADTGYRPAGMQSTKRWAENRPIWTHTDLNRIEGSLEMMWEALMRICRPGIPMILGGDEIYV